MTKDKVQAVFRQVFRNPSLVISDETTAADVEGWDSILHLELVLAVEKEFDLQFSTAELGRMKNVGEFLRLIEKKKAK